MASRSRPSREIVKAALRGTSTPKKDKKESKDDTTTPNATNYLTTAQRSHGKKVVLSELPANNESDDEDAVASPAKIRQGRRSDNARAERRTNILTSDVDPSSDSLPTHSQADTDEDTSDSDDLPPKRKGGYHPVKPGARCDCCIVARKRCDGVRPICGRCTEMNKECEWHDGDISKEELERMKEKVKADGMRARKKGTKRTLEEMTSDEPIKRGPKPKPVVNNDNDEDERKQLRDKRANHIQDLKAKQEALRKDRDGPDVVASRGYQSTSRATIADPEEDDQVTGPWGYEDHLDMLHTITEPCIDPVTGAEVIGHKKGNKVFDNATKALADFDAIDDDEVNMDHAPMYSGLVLNWEESDNKRGMPNANLSNRAGLLTNMRSRLGLPDYPVQSIEGNRPHNCPLPTIEDPDVQAAATKIGLARPRDLEIDPMRLSTLGRENFGFMDNWMSPHLGTDWDDGGHLPALRETADFDQPLSFDKFLHHDELDD